MSADLTTPAYVYDLDLVSENAREIAALLAQAGGSYFYPLKACSLMPVLEAVLPHVQGFEVSSLYEARLAAELCRSSLPIHCTSPGIRPDDLRELRRYCTLFSANSLTQLIRARDVFPKEKLSLRINPEISFVDDERYDPCRPGSKLGVPLRALEDALEEEPELAKQFSGITLHCFCEQVDFSGLDRLIETITPLLEAYSEHWQFLSLGGGFLFEDSVELAAIVQPLEKYKLEIAFEPGSGTVGDCATLHSRVVDLFDSGESRIAVLDTCVNHLPEAFEYVYRYPLAEDVDPENATHHYVLAGGTCLAGDLFGKYQFDRALAVGDCLTFGECGAYSIVKSTMFNGFSLPAIYLKKNGRLDLHRLCDYQDFHARFK